MRHDPDSNAGATLIELMIVVAIVGLLVAIAIPVVNKYARESRMSEAVSNIQGILSAEQAYFSSWQRYTVALPYCPIALPAGDENRNWTTSVAACNASWQVLGWSPDGPVHFQYRVVTDNIGNVCAAPNLLCPNGACCQSCNPNTNCVPIGTGQQPIQGLLCNGTADGNCDANVWAIDWTAAGFISPPAPLPIQSWCAVEAHADTDGDGNAVFFRGNSFNFRTYRTPNLDRNQEETY